MSELLIEVVGTPAPQGSKRWVGGHRMIESSKAVAPWRQAVAWSAVAAIQRSGWVRCDGPVEVSVDFFLPRPASAKRRVWPDRRPDLDKLLRSTFDALSEAGVWADDARVVAVNAGKTYRDTAGAIIRVEALDELGETA